MSDIQLDHTATEINSAVAKGKVPGAVAAGQTSYVEGQDIKAAVDAAQAAAEANAATYTDSAVSANQLSQQLPIIFGGSSQQSNRSSSGNLSIAGYGFTLNANGGGAASKVGDTVVLPEGRIVVKVSGQVYMTDDKHYVYARVNGVNVVTLVADSDGPTITANFSAVFLLDGAGTKALSIYWQEGDSGNARLNSLSITVDPYFS